MRKIRIVAFHVIKPLLAVVAFALPATALLAQIQQAPASNPARKPIMAISYPVGGGSTMVDLKSSGLVGR